jgi:hypothetical protein
MVRAARLERATSWFVAVNLFVDPAQLTARRMPKRRATWTQAERVTSQLLLYAASASRNSTFSKVTTGLSFRPSPCSSRTKPKRAIV